jgi:hypothetical protein
MDLEETIINLKILQKLEKNQKLITRGAYINIEPNSLVPEFFRRWNRQDNRNETLKKINTIINIAIDYLNKNEDDPLNIKMYLTDSKEGINNLKETYSTCHQTCARLDIILDKINTSIQQLNN